MFPGSLPPLHQPDSSSTPSIGIVFHPFPQKNAEMDGVHNQDLIAGSITKAFAKFHSYSGNSESCALVGFFLAGRASSKTVLPSSDAEMLRSCAMAALKSAKG
jgi:hypothetical protein